MLITDGTWRCRLNTYYFGSLLIKVESVVETYPVCSFLFYPDLFEDNGIKKEKAQKLDLQAQMLPLVLGLLWMNGTLFVHIGICESIQKNYKSRIVIWGVSGLLGTFKGCSL